MKYTISVVALASNVTSASASASESTGFSPCSNTSIQSTLDNARDNTSRNVEIRSFYRANEASTEEIPSEQQADIQIVPWYIADRV